MAKKSEAPAEKPAKSEKPAPEAGIELERDEATQTDAPTLPKVDEKPAVKQEVKPSGDPMADHPKFHKWK